MYPLEQANLLERIQNDNIQQANTHDVTRLASAIGQLSIVVDGLLTRLQEVEEKVSRIVQET
jgi:hypothetical protein